MRTALIELLQERLNENCKFPTDIRTASGCAILSIDIQIVTGERVSRQTLSRLTGVLADHPGPEIRMQSGKLFILARYLGHASLISLLNQLRLLTTISA